MKVSMGKKESLLIKGAYVITRFGDYRASNLLT
jgi:hypothetical protein